MEDLRRFVKISPSPKQEARIPGIFISYRRDDAAGEAGRLYSDLVREFPREEIFIDVATIQPGLDFRDQIKVRLDRCAVLLAVIGTDWLSASGNMGKSRIHSSTDFVHIEIAAALNRQIPVVPVLVQGAKVPEPEELPEDLQNLAYRSAEELTHARWASDLQVLIQNLRQLIVPRAAELGDSAGNLPATRRTQRSASRTYDELAQLRRELSYLKIENKSLLALLKSAAKEKRSWSRSTSADLINLMDPLLYDYDSLNSAYWYLILYGVLRFNDINGGWTYASYKQSMRYTQIAARGMALLNELASEG